MWGTCESALVSLSRPFPTSTVAARSGNPRRLWRRSRGTLWRRQRWPSSDGASLMRHGTLQSQHWLVWGSPRAKGFGCVMPPGLGGSPVPPNLAPQEAKFLIAKQKYLEDLEAGKITAALHVLRNELAPLNPELDSLHTLSRSVALLATSKLRADCIPPQSHDVFGPC